MASLASALSDTLYWLALGSKLDWKQRTLVALSGNTLTGILSTCFSCCMLLSLYAYAESDRDLHLFAVMYCVCFMGSFFVQFWGMHRDTVRRLFVLMRRTVTEMEREFPADKTGSEFVPVIKLTSRLVWWSPILQAIAVILLPTRRSIFPPDLREPWALACIRVLQSMMLLSMGVTVSLFFDAQVSFVWYLRASHSLLGRFLQSADDSAIVRIARFHSQLLAVSYSRKTLFSSWNAFIFLSMLLSALYNTLLLVKGILIPSINALLLITWAFAFMMCTIGNILEESCEKFADDLNRTPWHSQTPRYKKIMLFMILRCKNPEVVHAKLFGPVSLPLFIKFCQNYYRFVQAVINIK